MTELERTLILSGVLVLALGGVMVRPDLFGVGRLPGDLRAKAGHVTVHFPIVTTLLVSALVALAYAAATSSR